MANLFAKKDLPTLMKEAVEVEGEQTLRRALGPLNLLTLGIGAIIGAGIFVITGQAAAQFAGPAIVITLITTVLVIGIKESANFTTAVVIMKVAVVCMFIVLAAAFLLSHEWKPNYWHPFIPANTGEWGHFGWSGILRGAGVVFFAY